MRAYERRGLTWSDCLDYTVWGKGRAQLGAKGRLSGNAFYLKHAASLRAEHARSAHKPQIVLFHLERPIDAAARYIAKAREYRLELQGAR